MKERLAKLIDVKSIMTILLTAMFCILVYAEKLDQQFMTIYSVIVAFYFGTQANKNS